MKRIFKCSVPVIMFITLLTIFTSCSDWTDVENIDIYNPGFEEQNPQLHADYIRDLKKYKSGEHKLTFVSFNNPSGNPINQAERLTAIADSVDFICLNNPDNLGSVTQNEMEKVREKSTHVLYTIDYQALEEEWKALQKEDAELTEEEALAYLGNRIDAMLSLCDTYNYDGIVISYNGRSLVSLTESALAKYGARQQNLFGRVTDWRNKHTAKTLAFNGNIQYLMPENMGMLGICDYIMLKTETSTNADDLTLKAYWAVQAGEDAKSEYYHGVNPVRTVCFIVCVELPQANDKNQSKGYWNTLNTDGNKVTAALGAAGWMLQASPDFIRKGLFIMNAQTDYYNNTYMQVREVINIMNPNK